MKNRIYLRKPGKYRNEFKLIEGTKTVESPELKSVSNAYIEGELEYFRAEAMAQDIVESIRRQSKPQDFFLKENEELVARYIREKLALKTNRAPEAAIDRMYRVAKALGKLSIRSANILDIRKALDKWDGRPYNDRVGALNQLLKYAGRPDRLPRKHENPPNPRFLTLKDFKTVIELVPDMNMRCLMWVAFGTGARFGEIFGLSRFEGEQVWIDCQIKRGGAKAPTKNLKVGWAAVIPEASVWVNMWLNLPTEVKERLRRNNHYADVVRKACVLAFPDSEEKHCKFHDLRHSYAHYCLTNGKSLEDVREWLRDEIATVERYYLGWGRGKRKGF